MATGFWRAELPGDVDSRALTRYALLFILAYGVAGVVWMIGARGMLDPRGEPVGYDFITFWSASWLALGGRPEAAYQMSEIAAAQQVAVTAFRGVFLWHYPPTFFLVALPLSLLPYLVSYLTFVGVTFAGLAAVVRRIVPARGWLLGLCAFPGTFINGFQGQNGFLTASLLGGGLVLLQRRPALAGVCFGLLTVKPHLGLLIPVALALSRQWRAFAFAAVTAVAFLGLSTAVLGRRTLEAFIDNAPVVRFVLEAGILDWDKMPTTFAAVRLIGGGVTAGYALQGIVAAVALAAVAWLWSRPHPLPLAVRGSGLVTAALLTPPYLFNYDMMACILPLAWLAHEGWRKGFLKGEKAVLAAVWIAPIVVFSLAKQTGVQLAPVVLLALLGVVVRRALATPAP
ncbi:MAG: glycosyltransferase family 87 protein [Rhodospirillaceae bacterium]